MDAKFATKLTAIQALLELVSLDLARLEKVTMAGLTAVADDECKIKELGLDLADTVNGIGELVDKYHSNVIGTIKM